MKNTILLILIILSITSCQKQKANTKTVDTDWLVGKWENNTKDGDLVETWTKVNDSLFIAESYFIKEKDTLHSEKIQLKQKGENLFYISTIKGQNKDQPITFKHNIEIKKQLVFENPKSDYPKKIVYQAISKDSLSIDISGIIEKKPCATHYSMKKNEK